MMSDDLLKRHEEPPITVKPCPNCRKSHWTNSAMSFGYERLECHECGLVLWGFSGLFTEEPAIAAWNIMSDRIEELTMVLEAVDAWVEDLGYYADEGAELAPVFKKVKAVLGKGYK